MPGEGARPDLPISAFAIRDMAEFHSGAGTLFSGGTILEYTSKNDLANWMDFSASSVSDSPLELWANMYVYSIWEVMNSNECHMDSSGDGDPFFKL